MDETESLNKKEFFGLLQNTSDLVSKEAFDLCEGDPKAFFWFSLGCGYTIGALVRNLKNVKG